MAISRRAGTRHEAISAHWPHLRPSSADDVHRSHEVRPGAFASRAILAPPRRDVAGDSMDADRSTSGWYDAAFCLERYCWEHTQDCRNGQADENHSHVYLPLQTGLSSIWLTSICPGLSSLVYYSNIIRKKSNTPSTWRI